MWKTLWGLVFEWVREDDACCRPKTWLILQKQNCKADTVTSVRSSVFKVANFIVLFGVALLNLAPALIPQSAQAGRQAHPRWEIPSSKIYFKGRSAAQKTLVSGEEIQRVLSWLPADTETVIGANGPFVLPDTTAEVNETENGKSSDQEIEEEFRGIPLGLFSYKKDIFAKHFKGEKVLLGIEGSRQFRYPSGLGEGPYQGCAIAIFVNDITDRTDSFMNDATTAAIRMERIEGQKVAVFQEELETDTWTTFIAFPKPNVAVAASDRDYLVEVLARINGKTGPRALPESLAEWKHVNIQDQFWGVRHYSKKDTQLDPTSPFRLGGLPGFADQKAIGLTFDFDPGKSKTAMITCLSDNEKILELLKRNFFPLRFEPEAKELNIRYQQVEKGVVVGSFDLKRQESANLFALELLMLLGHEIFI